MLVCQANDIKEVVVKVGVKGNLEKVPIPPQALDSYTLSVLAEQKLGDCCGPKSLHLCSEKSRAMWEKHLERKPAAVEATLDKRFKEIVVLGRKANKFGAELQAKYGAELQTNEEVARQAQAEFNEHQKSFNELQRQVFEANRQFLRLYKYNSGKEYQPKIDLSKKERKKED